MSETQQESREAKAMRLHLNIEELRRRAALRVQLMTVGELIKLAKYLEQEKEASNG